jgi:hypothetical protein
MGPLKFYIRLYRAIEDHIGPVKGLYKAIYGYIRSRGPVKELYRAI